MARKENTSPLTVYGDATKFRGRLRELIKQGDDLVAKLDSAESRYTPPGGPPKSKFAGLEEFIFASDTTDAISKWSARIYRTLNQYLGAEAPDWEKPAPLGDLDAWDLRVIAAAAREMIVTRQDGLRRLADRIPGRQLVISPPAGPNLVELRASRVIDEKVLDGYARRMSKFNTVHQCAEAIGASKELLEATYRGVLDLLGEHYTKKDDYPVLGKKARNALIARVGLAPSDKGAAAIRQILTGLGTVNHALAELRNEYGTGHGRPKHADGLTVRHARLAVDLATTECRYLALTVQDLNLLTG